MSLNHNEEDFHLIMNVNLLDRKLNLDGLFSETKNNFNVINLINNLCLFNFNS